MRARSGREARQNSPINSSGSRPTSGPNAHGERNRVIGPNSTKASAQQTQKRHGRLVPCNPVSDDGIYFGSFNFLSTLIGRYVLLARWSVIKDIDFTEQPMKNVLING